MDTRNAHATQRMTTYGAHDVCKEMFMCLQLICLNAVFVISMVKLTLKTRPTVSS